VEGRIGERKGEEKEMGEGKRERGGKEGEGEKEGERVDPQGFSEMTPLTYRLMIGPYCAKR